jgi:AAA domain-containing protein
MIYGDGGTAKTTLAIDLAFHLAAGDKWLGMTVARQARVLLIEVEGPRPMFRKKLARKLTAWSGSALGGRVSVFERPWAAFSFAEEAWREQLVRDVQTLEVDVIIAGPLVRLGMDTAGTLQEVVEFHQLIQDVRSRCGRPLTIILAHHANKGGAVSGAWEGAGDTLLHTQAAGNGHTVVYVQKARWASSLHHTTLKLAWTAGEGFELEGERDLRAEVIGYLDERQPATVKEIAAAAPDGIGANDSAVKTIVEAEPDVFELLTGDAAKLLGRHRTARVWKLHRGSNAPDAPRQQTALLGGVEDAAALLHPLLRDAAATNAPPHASSKSASEPTMHPTDCAVEAIVALNRGVAAPERARSEPLPEEDVLAFLVRELDATELPPDDDEESVR